MFQESESSFSHLLLGDSFHRKNFLNIACAIDLSIKSYLEDKLLSTLLSRSENFNNDKNKKQ